MEIGSWAFITVPSLWALVPLFLYIAIVFMGKDNIPGLMVGIIVGALMLGFDFNTLAKTFQAAFGTSTALLGVIIMTGSGLGVVMTEARITHTLIYWIIKGVGVTTRTRGKLVLVVSSTLVCGMLGTMCGGNSVIAPVMLPILASLGVTPSVVAILFKVSGEIGLILGPLTGVTLVTMEITGLSYLQLLMYATLPFSAIWLWGSWVAANRAQRRTEGKEFYPFGESVENLESLVISTAEKNSTIVFLLTFTGLVAYGLYSKQGTDYALVVMIVLSIIVTITSRMEIDKAIVSMVKGMASMMNMFVASIVGAFCIEATAVAEIKIISEMFGDLAAQVGLPMGCFAVALLAATRLTGSVYPTSNIASQLGISRCNNMKEVLQANWISVAFVSVYIVTWAYAGPRLLG